jgi:hypothetical protein
LFFLRVEPVPNLTRRNGFDPTMISFQTTAA